MERLIWSYTTCVIVYQFTQAQKELKCSSSFNNMLIPMYIIQTSKVKALGRKESRKLMQRTMDLIWATLQAPLLSPLKLQAKRGQVRERTVPPQTLHILMLPLSQMLWIKQRYITRVACSPSKLVWKQSCPYQSPHHHHSNSQQFVKCIKQKAFCSGLPLIQPTTSQYIYVLRDVASFQGQILLGSISRDTIIQGGHYFRSADRGKHGLVQLTFDLQKERDNPSSSKKAKVDTVLDNEDKVNNVLRSMWLAMSRYQWWLKVGAKGARAPPVFSRWGLSPPTFLDP